MNSKKIYHIGIAGNIGAGKTTLAEKLGSHFNWQIQYEQVDDNPYLEDFYEDMHRWAFNLQIFFLHSRIKQMFRVLEENKTVIQDRTIYEDAKIFAPNLYDMGLMSERDYNNYLALFETISAQVKPPDLLHYLNASIPKLVSNIQKRGREFEENLRLDYLKRLNEYYNSWIGSYTAGNLLIIEVDEMDFANNPEDLGAIINSVDSKLHGLFSDTDAA